MEILERPFRIALSSVADVPGTIIALSIWTVKWTQVESQHAKVNVKWLRVMPAMVY